MFLSLTETFCDIILITAVEHEVSHGTSGSLIEWLLQGLGVIYVASSKNLHGDEKRDFKGQSL